tara:strand:+ start:489 stop:737 length:249 start_codon:yes stop_codon:yes gene_type:complete
MVPLLLLVGLLFLLVGKWIILIIIGIRVSAPPNMKKIGEDNFLENHMRNKQRAFGFGLNIHKIFEILWGVWWVLAIVWVLNR